MFFELYHMAWGIFMTVPIVASTRNNIWNYFVGNCRIGNKILVDGYVSARETLLVWGSRCTYRKTRLAAESHV